MSENKSGMSRWVPTVTLGVLAVLFSFWALQLQSELLVTRERIKELEIQSAECDQKAEVQRVKIEEALKISTEQAEIARRALDECQSNKRK